MLKEIDIDNELEKEYEKLQEQNLRVASISLASQHYLCDGFPSNFIKWPNKKIYKYCSDNAWEPFQFYDGEEIYRHISTLADSFIKFKNLKD